MSTTDAEPAPPTDAEALAHYRSCPPARSGEHRDSLYWQGLLVALGKAYPGRTPYALKQRSA